MNQDQDRQETIDAIRKLINDIHIAMLTTQLDDGSLRSRPMITAHHEFDGYVWFFTSAIDPKVQEIAAHPQVNVAYSSPNNDKYVSLTGKAELLTDRKLVETHWTEEMLEWFPDGLNDQSLALLRVDVSEAEYWNNKAGRLGGFVKSMFTEKDEGPKGEHQKIQWEESVSVT